MFSLLYDSGDTQRTTNSGAIEQLGTGLGQIKARDRAWIAA